MIDARSQLRYMYHAWRYLREGEIDLLEAQRIISEGLASRATNFLDTVERGVFAYPASPYARLFANAGITMQDLRRMVTEDGVEGALSRLHDTGVYLSMEESRGLVPVRRGSFEMSVAYEDLDNPHVSAGYEGSSSGSRSGGRRVWVDFDLLRLEAAYATALFAAHGVFDRPIAIWRPGPPDVTAFNGFFRYARSGKRPTTWFSQSPTSLGAAGKRHFSFIQSTRIASMLAGRPLPAPQHVLPTEALTVTRWLASHVAAGAPAFLDTSASCAVRICLEAEAHRLDLRGTIIRVGGEPYTEAKAEVLARAGVYVFDRYAMTEMSIVALGCANPSALDDMHVALDKVSLSVRERPTGIGSATVPSLVYTTIEPTMSKLFINVESGDYATLDERRCGCLLESFGLTTHLSNLRSHDKITSEGVSFSSDVLYELVEEILPARFGGHATDYQLVEEEESGVPRVSVIVAPRVGAVDEAAVVETIVSVLEQHVESSGRRRVDYWKGGQTLRVIRREPHVSGGRKVLPLHVLRTTEKVTS